MAELNIIRAKADVSTMRVGVIGATGYIGGELLRILLRHPKVEVSIATSREMAGEFVFRVHPNLRGVTNLKFNDLNLSKLTDNCDLVFTATPHGASMKIIPQILEVGLRVIDMSADFRLKNPNDYPKWYNREHSCPDLLKESVYGLPELHRSEIKDAKLISCPGCIATSAILALAPIIKENAVENDRIIVDAKIGSSGAGGKPSLSTHHAERFGVVRPYKPVGHRHTAEIEQELSNIAKNPVTVSLSPHAVNMVRGILSTIHAFTTRSLTINDVWQIYRNFYKDEPFIRFVRDRKGVFRFPDPKIVVGSNFCDIGFELDYHVNRIVIMSAIDNLIKGGAGQAVQDMNILMGIDERVGLESPALHPI
jgi:N-acetyl-gamma-glutamyl-phosphate/LysW-gamma-L-alpha-aminoadipyl-6-phosphate reductase